MTPSYGPGISIVGNITPEFAEILTPQAIEFVAAVAHKFGGRRQELLAKRVARQQEFDAGKMPDFLPDTASIRAGDWKIAPQPPDLLDRRVEITGPTDRKMVINALNSGAKVFMADFEDSNAPTWANMVEGQINLRDAVNRSIAFEANGKSYKLNDKTAVLLVRPRGWHLEEKHMLVDGVPVAAAFFDFGLYFFHNAKTAIAHGTGPYFYLPKMEGHGEARLWNDVFVMAQRVLGIPQGTIKATVLIETVLAAFEMDEILYELREHSAGLNIGRWDYIFSCIKKFRSNRDFCLADRSQVSMTSPFMRAYALSLIKTCHHRNAPAMGGMAAQIPIKNDPAANEAALAKVRDDKEREATDGCDGTWVAHPGLVGIAMDIFNKHMPTPNQYHRQLDEVKLSATALMEFRPEGPITEAGLRNNISVGIQYLGAWLAGNGCVPVFNLMEDAATAEICRAQVWQWVKFGAKLDDGRPVTAAMVNQVVDEQLAKRGNADAEFTKAAQIFRQMMTSADFQEFLTLPAYSFID
jgi:malate synthase